MTRFFISLLLVSAPSLAFPPEQCSSEKQCVCAPHPAYATDCTHVDKKERGSRFLSQAVVMYQGFHL